MRRKDLGLLIVVGFLFAALTFNLGLYWGVKWGLGKSAVAVAPHSPTHVAPHPHAIEASNQESAPNDVIEQDWHTKKEIPESIREGFVKSKQNALIESQLRSKDRKMVGTSIADAEAFFAEKKMKWGAITEEVQKLARSIASEEKSSKAPEVRKIPSSALFERSPASVKSFKAIPGQFTVQVASYATEEEAIARVKVLIGEGIADAYYAKTMVRGEAWFQVSVGSFRDTKWAKHQGDQMVRRGIASDYFIRKIPD